MDFMCVKLAVVLMIAERISALPLACLHNGTSYNDGETVGTEDPCLSCACQRGALECSVRICPDYPNALPPACFLVHQPNECCPQLFCEKENFSPDGVELRTALELETKSRGNDCVINGSTYAEGSAVGSSLVCEYCYCFESEVKCIKPRCLQSFEDCKPVFEKSSCCPTHFDCRDADVNFLKTRMDHLGSTNSKVIETSFRSLMDSDIDFDNENNNVSGDTHTEQITEKSAGVTKEMSTEETSPEPSEDTTWPATKEDFTTLGFQATKTENVSEDLTAVTTTIMEETTLSSDVAKTSVVTNNGLSTKEDISEGSNAQNPDLEGSLESRLRSRDNSSQEAEDYESYDYSEPQLPPSLPNLVIFPFVAADAVVKDETTAVTDIFDKAEIKRIDAQPVFYTDLFSPPTETEGGFVPKEPPLLGEPLYDYGYFGKQQIEPPRVVSSLYVASAETPKETNVSQATEKPVTEVTFIEGNPKPTLDPFETAVGPGTETGPAFLLENESTTFFDSHQMKKPVTVTYKNLVVNFYPNYLITTSKKTLKAQPVENFLTEIQSNTEGHLQSLMQNPHLETAAPESVLDIFDDENTSSSPPNKKQIDSTRVQSVPSTTSGESSFSEQFFNTFLTEQSTTAAGASTKHKFSSKIKGPQRTTPKVDKKITEVAKTNSATVEWSMEVQDSTATDKQTEPTATRRPVKKEQNGSSTTQVLRKPSKPESQGLAEASGNAVALLKLAGCNIYGMMYRVGKVIAELSGPCLECLCTNFGVQCTPLGC